MDLARVADAVQGVPNMTAAQGARVVDHLERTGARDVLELGTAHGVSSAWMAAAVGPRGGRVTTVDHAVATRLRDPQPGDVHRRAGVEGHVDRVLVEDSSYTWWLGEQVVAATGDDGGVTPRFDFCYLDGAHNWTIDGFAVVLVERLLRPGAWLLLDDLDWSYGDERSSFGPGQGPDALGLSAAERAVPHMQLVLDVVVAGHPSFADLRVEDGAWGWAHKAPGAPRTYTTVRTGPSPARRAAGALRRRLRALRAG